MCCRSALGVRIESTDSPPDLKTLRHSLSPKMLSTTKDPEIETRISGSASFKTAKIQKAHKATRKQIVGQLAAGAAGPSGVQSPAAASPASPAAASPAGFAAFSPQVMASFTPEQMAALGAAFAGAAQGAPTPPPVVP